MSKADKILKELGYTVEEGNRNIFIYIDDGEYINHSFVIHKESKTITVYKQLVTMQELQAINQKCRELGWIGGEDE